MRYSVDPSYLFLRQDLFPSRDDSGAVPSYLVNGALGGGYGVTAPGVLHDIVLHRPGPLQSEGLAQTPEFGHGTG